MKVSDLVTKQLLHDIESEGASRKDFCLPRLVTAKSNIYGEKGSELRRAVQKKFDSLKRKTPLSYKSLLDKFDVDPSDSLKRELRGGGEAKENSEALKIAPCGSETWRSDPFYLSRPVLQQSPPTGRLLRRQQQQRRVMRDKASDSNSLSPRYEMMDNNETFEIAVDVPGVKIEDIDIRLEGTILTVRGQGKSRDDTHSLMSTFAKTVSLDPAIDADKFSAIVVNGVLIISAPKHVKRNAEKIRKIPITETKQVVDAEGPYNERTLEAIDVADVKTEDITTSDTKSDDYLEISDDLHVLEL